MDEDVVVQVENVSKVYQLYDKPQDRLKQALFWRFGKRYGREFWALRDVSFQVRRGETVGIIGRNGSGKSTLLQIIAGTLQPTSGSVQVRGRVAALLELGSGFNPEFTGRENVYMAGSLLGLSDAEVASHFDAIEKFAEIGDFIDQPVKLYSSGMFVRLAFSVQAILPKDILIVDEALAVGDASFQRKCYQRLEQFREQGGTVLLVTHDVQTVVRECSWALMLCDGDMVAFGETKAVCDFYQKIIFSGNVLAAELLAKAKVTSWYEVLNDKHLLPHMEPAIVDKTAISYGNGHAFIIDYGLYKGRLKNRHKLFTSGSSYSWFYKIKFDKLCKNVRFGVMIKTVDGICLCHMSTYYQGMYIEEINCGAVYEVCFDIVLNLLPGNYIFNCGVSGDVDGEHVLLHRLVDIFPIEVISGTSKFIDTGLVFVNSTCSVNSIDQF